MNFQTKITISAFILVILSSFCNVHGFFFNDETRDDIPPIFEEFKELEEDNKAEASEFHKTTNSFNPFHLSADLFKNVFSSDDFPPGLSFLKRTVGQPWWKGENVCHSQVETVVNKSDVSAALNNESPFIFFGNAAFSTCRATLNKYICTNKKYTRGDVKTTEVVYQCCPGSRKNTETQACDHVDIKSLTDTAKELGSAEFAKLVDSSVKKSVIDTPNMTIFMPADEAINVFIKNKQPQFMNERVVHAIPLLQKKFSNDSAENEVLSSINEKTEKNPVSNLEHNLGERALNHFVPSVIDVHELENEEILKTVDGLPIRMNVYHSDRNPVITANCARVKSANYPIKNSGMVHVTDAVLPQVTKSIRDILLESNDLKTFTKFADDAELMDKLGQDGNFTVFAFTDSAFNNLDDEFKSSINKGKSCIKILMKAHIIPRTLCQAAFGGLTVMTRSISGNWLTIEKTENNTLFVGRESETTETDIVTSNGVIHLIDRPIVPHNAQPVSELLANTNQTKWMELLKKADMMDEFTDSSNRTMFVPSESAIVEAKLDELEVDKLKEILSMHISNESVCTCQMERDLMIPTQEGKQQLRITSYQTSGSIFMGSEPKYMVQCASIVNKDERACDTVVHEIDQVIKPATNTIVEKIETDSRLTKVKNLLQNTSLYEELKNGSLDHITLLAPTEEAFAQLSEDDWKILEDKDKADELLRRHILEDVICCNGVGQSAWPFVISVNSISGISLDVHRRSENVITFGETTTESCDILAKDGLIHYVNKVMVPHSIGLKKGSAVKYMDPNGSEVVLYGI